jgi:hypothetical protein
MELHGEKEGVNQKSIPVQQMEAFREKEDSEGIGKRGRTASLKNAAQLVTLLRPVQKDNP